MTHSRQDRQIKNGFIRMLARGPARLGPDLPLLLVPGEEGSAVRERYAPMQRLLAEDDELFLKRQGFHSAAKKLRREHRRCYFSYGGRLAREIGTAPNPGPRGMQPTA